MAAGSSRLVAGAAQAATDLSGWQGSSGGFAFTRGEAIAKLKTKAEIVAALKDSFVQAHAFVNSVTPENAFLETATGGTRVGMTSFGLAHMMDHYGQLVVYLRMNGIVPPASRAN